MRGKIVVLLCILFMICFSTTAMALEKEYIKVNINVTFEGTKVTNGANYTGVVKGDQIKVTASCKDERSIDWSTNPNYMKDKGYTYNTEGMAFLGYMFDSTDKTKYIVDYSNPTSMTVTIPDFKAGTEHFLVMEAVAAIDGLEEDGKEIEAVSGNFVVYFTMAEKEATTVDINARIGSTVLTAGETNTCEGGEYVTMTGTSNINVSAIQYTYNGSSNNTSGSSAIITIPEPANEEKTYTLKCKAKASDGTLSEEKTYKFKVPAKAKTEIDVDLKDGSKVVTPGSTMVKKAGDKLTIVATSNIGVEKISYIMSGMDDYVDKNGSSCTVTVPDYPAGSELELYITACATDGTWVDPVKEYKIKIAEEEKPESVSITLTKGNDNAKVEATVENGTFKQFVYNWDNGSDKTLSNNPSNISYPTEVGKHTLKVYAVTESGMKSETKTLEYEVEAPEEKITITLTKGDDNAKVEAKVENGVFNRFVYNWDNGTDKTSSNNPTTISFPTEVGKHTLKVYGLTDSGLKSDTKIIEYEVKAPDDPKVEKITITLTKGDDSAKVEAKVENGVFNRFVYNWDNGTDKTNSNNPITISYPTEVGKHTLKVYGLTDSGLKSETKTLEVEVKAPDALEGTITAKTPDGDTLSEDSKKPTETEPDTKITVTVKPEDNFSKVEYNWDDGTMKPLPSDRIIKVPSDFKPGTTHKLTIEGTLKDGGKVRKVYYITIPKDDEGDLDIDPWMKENDDAEGLIISLRNRSDTKKANMNFYMIGEEVIYLVDYKNAGKKIDSEVKVELKLPLEFKVVEADGGTVDASKKTITWTHAKGLSEGFANTKKVVVKYTALSKKSYNSEMIYPQAIIYKAGKKQDTSAVINCIYKDEDTLLDEVHKPYMFGDADQPTFRPDDGISRAEGGLVLMRIFGVNYKSVTNITTKYSDIEETYMEARKAITKATELGVIEGYPDGTYRPKDKMTRAEFMNIIAKYVEKNAEVDGLEIKEEDAVVLYKNPKSGNTWALPAVTLLARLNMTSVSSSEKDLRLGDNITRAEVAQLCNFYLFRAPAKTSSSTKLEFTDVSRNHKLFADIIEATREEHEFTVTEDGKEKVK